MRTTSVVYSAGNNVKLRPICPKDGKRIYEIMRTDWYGLALTGIEVGPDGSLPWSLEEVERLYEQWSNDDTRAMFAIEIAGDKSQSVNGTCVGEIVLNEYDKQTNSANMRVYIGTQWRGCGYGCEAVEAVLKYGFSAGLDAITLEVYDHNPHARRLYESFGFRAVSYHKKEIRIAGIWYGSTDMRLTAHEYQQLHNSHTIVGNTDIARQLQSAKLGLDTVVHIAHSFDRAPTEQIHELLRDFNRKHFEVTDEREIVCWVEHSGQLVAGVYGNVFGQWLEIEILVVSDAWRGMGIGSGLLNTIEKEGVQLGAKYALLNTFNFQGKDFYPKYGYTQIGEIANYPLTGSQHWFTKEL